MDKEKMIEVNYPFYIQLYFIFCILFLYHLYLNIILKFSLFFGKIAKMITIAHRSTKVRQVIPET